MATRRSTRITQVNPWIVGGEGQLRDLFPLPPWFVLFVARPLGWAFRHYLVTITVIISIALFTAWHWNPYLAFFGFPLLVLTLRTGLITAYLWYKNPTIPLIARKGN